MNFVLCRVVENLIEMYALERFKLLNRNLKVEKRGQISCLVKLECVQVLLEQTQRDRQFMEQSLNHHLEARFSKYNHINLIFIGWLTWKVMLISLNRGRSEEVKKIFKI